MFRCYLDSPLAKVPAKANPLDAGFDLYAIEDCTIQPQSSQMVDTGIIIEIPEDCYARIAPRSGLAAKNGIDVLAGVVDCTFRGRVKVILINHGVNPFVVSKGDRIAQMIFEKIYSPLSIQVVSDVKDLQSTERGAGGFGSTGV
jgi:dUTP pyrophosphatase